MKKDIHPQYGKVIFLDISTGDKFLINSTLTSDETQKWEDGNEYPVIKLDVTSASHPFYTGKDSLIDTEGRVDKFNKKMALAQEKQAKILAKKERAAKQQEDKGKIKDLREIAQAA